MTVKATAVIAEVEEKKKNKGNKEEKYALNVEDEKRVNKIILVLYCMCLL